MEYMGENLSKIGPEMSKIFDLAKESPAVFS